MSHADVVERLVSQQVASGLSARDASVFAGPDEVAVRASVQQRLGWIEAPSGMPDRLVEVDRLVEAALAERLTGVYLLGMGGGSLCAEVLNGVADALAAAGRRAIHCHLSDPTADCSAELE